MLQTPPGVHAYERRSATHRLVFLLNFSEQALVVRLDEPWEDMFTGKKVEKIVLELAGVSIIRHNR